MMDDPDNNKKMQQHHGRVAKRSGELPKGQSGQRQTPGGSSLKESRLIIQDSLSEINQILCLYILDN